jgi:hypothetical protein
MKAMLTVKIKSGYLIVEREIESLTSEEICSGTVVGEDEYSYRDKAGRVAVDILNPPTKEEAPL